MKITLNGQEKDLNSSLNLAELVEQFCQTPARVITEVNGDIIKNPQWQNTQIQDGDQIELVSFVGGG